MRTPTRKDRLDETEAEFGEPAELPELQRENLPMIAIVGRPNVGKSTLFNRLIGRRDALVHDRPGMTRDRRIERVDWSGRGVLFVDTGGFETELDDPLLEDVVEQARIAMDEADVLVLLTAVGEERNPAELELVELLRKGNKPLLVAVNKCDNPAREIEATAFYEYGFPEIHPISALHGHGVADLLDGILDKLKKVEVDPSREHMSGGLEMAIVGRQNVGKSTLVNRLIGEQRLIASDVPGTTRDAIDMPLTTPDGDSFTLIDTAGIRRRGKVERGIEKLCVLSSMIAIRRADVAILVIDGSEGLTAQDAHIANFCVEEGCSCVLAVNKWDLVEKDHKTADMFTKSTEREWPFLKYAPIVYLSAKTGQRATRVLEIAKRVYMNGGRRIPTPKLNDLLTGWVARKSPAIRQNRKPKIRYMAQTGVHPPTFTVFVNDRRLFHFSYVRYLLNRLREEADFEGVPIRMMFKDKRGHKQMN